jgi:4-amino-4-deoxy-L-arabinose transferase-like glycosyltransferase
MASGRLSFWIEPANPRRNLQLLRAVFWFVTACAGFLQVWSARFSVSPDGNCYLDIASAYLNGDWNHAVNAYWSPLFPWLLAICLWVFHPSPYWESTLLHLLNFIALLVSLLSFEFFFRSFLHLRKHFNWDGENDRELPELAWWALGYGLFLSTSLFILTSSLTMPDMWVAAATYLVAGLILRIWTQGGSWGLFTVLGFALGCAYLTKTFYFPMTFIFLPTAWLATGNPRKTLKQAILAFVIFALIAGPWIATLSRAKNRVTFGDVGKLSFAMMIDQIQQPLFWQGENGTGTPKHPVRQLLTHPRIFEFGTPVGGSYPPVFDQSYWMEGVTPYFSFRGQLRVLRQSAGTMFKFFGDQIEFAAGLLCLFFLLRSKRECVALLRKQSYLWVPPLIACFSYALVLVEGRYVAPFILLLWVAAFSCLLACAPQLTSRSAVAMVLAILSVTGLRIAKSATSDLLTVLAKPANLDWEIAQALHHLGIQPGDKVAGLSRVAEAHWARLAGVKIVSEIPLGEERIFWTASPDLQRQIFGILAGTGAKIVVTKDPPPCAINTGWLPLGTTGYYVLPLSSQPSSQSTP